MVLLTDIRLNHSGRYNCLYFLLVFSALFSEADASKQTHSFWLFFFSLSCQTCLSSHSSDQQHFFFLYLETEICILSFNFVPNIQFSNSLLPFFGHRSICLQWVFPLCLMYSPKFWTTYKTYNIYIYMWWWRIASLYFLDYDRLRIGGIIFTVLLVIGAIVLLFRKSHFLILLLSLISRLGFVFFSFGII